ncbi:MAG TPA: hypothetical protein VK633_10835 [Verrucomicrobiae bacterium]|nr:hypothetical protein [Verrucomicrobiae bacterium]
MEKAVAAGRSGAANLGPSSAVELQAIAHIVPADRMRYLGVQQRDDMAPIRKSRALSAAPVSRANLETRWPGMTLQICLRTVNFEPADNVLFFITALWRFTKDQSSHFFFSAVGWL